MFLSRLTNPCQSQKAAETRYAPQDNMDIPAARCPTQIARTWGTVITIVKIERPPRSRLINPCGGSVRIDGVVGSGGMYYPQSGLNRFDLKASEASFAPSPLRS